MIGEAQSRKPIDGDVGSKETSLYEWGDDSGAFFESKDSATPLRPALLQGSDSSDTSSDSDESVNDADTNVGKDSMQRRKALR